jgi:glyoxylase-like metal-dependent hydrolase (beta-lactamase superfamily II)
MIENVLPDIYKIEIPLPNNPLKATNSYLIRGKKRNLLIDTGFNCEECRTAMDKALKNLGVGMDTTDLFITHLHADHSGLTKYLARPDTTIWMSEDDGKVVATSQASAHWKMFSDFLVISGLLAAGVEDRVDKHPGYKYACENFDNFTTVNEGYEIKVGNYCFQCVETKGHTAGHMCLYDSEKKLLISGDHILGKITPNITLWRLEVDVLGNYLQNLDKIAALEVNIVLPGHRFILTDCRGRINELKEHHNKRMDDIITIISGERMNAAQVASRMKWDLSYKTWGEFPWGQKLFATGEAMSHLYHLEAIGRLTKSEADNIIYFEKA